MATINDGNLTLLDNLKRRDPGGAIAKIVEALSLSSPLLQDMVWKEGNLTTGELVTTRTALPPISWRRMNEGVAPSKSITDQVTETCGMLNGQSIVDVKLAKLGGDEMAFRASEDKAFVQAMNNTLESAYFYASTKVNPERLMGLSPRLDAISGNPYANQIINFNGGSGASGNDQNSIWLVGWGDETVYGIYPKGSVGGLQYKDMGEQLVLDSNSRRFRAYVTDWSWDAGLVVKDARYLIRIANVDTSNLLATGKLLIQDMIRATERIQDLDNCRPVFYCNRRVREFLRLQSQDTSQNSTITFDTVAGKPVMMFGGVPVRRTDALLSTESPIT